MNSRPAQTDPVVAFRRELRLGRTEAALGILIENSGAPAADAELCDWLLGEGRHEQAAPLLQRLARQDDLHGRIARSALALASGELGTAVEAARSALAINRNSASALGHLGRALFNAGRLADAERCFAEAVDCDPESALAWYNRGHLERAAGQMDRALEAYGRALDLAPGFRAARLNRGITQALAEAPAAALLDFERLLELDPGDLDARLNAGLAHQTLGEMDAAEADYRAVINSAPEHALAWCYLGILLNEQLRSAESIAALERALQLDPNEIDVRRELANVHEKSNRLDQAEAVLAPVLGAVDQHPGVAIDAARLHRRRGRIEQALALLGRIDPAVLPHRLELEYRYELAQALDRAGRYPQALQAFAAANRAAAGSARRARIDPQAFAREVAGIDQWLSRGAPGIESDAEADSGADLCFMIGFPRCGTTLLDTILNAAEEIATVDERPTFERARREIESEEQPYWARSAGISKPQAHAFRRAYRAALVAEVGSHTGRLMVDKLPLRLLHAPLLAQAFPQARFVFSLRHPADVVLSNFMQHYVPNEAYIHFDTLDQTVRTYAAVMRLWAKLRPRIADRLHLVRYESLVTHPEQEIEAVCAFLGLAFDPLMLDPERRLRDRERIRTNSYEQVAEPIYRRSAGRWRNYREALMPYRDELEPFVEAYGYAMD